MLHLPNNFFIFRDTARNEPTRIKDMDDYSVTSPRDKFNQSIGDLMSSVS